MGCNVDQEEGNNVSDQFVKAKEKKPTNFFMNCYSIEMFFLFVVISFTPPSKFKYFRNLMTQNCAEFL